MVSQRDWFGEGGGNEAFEQSAAHLRAEKYSAECPSSQVAAAYPAS